MRHLLCTAIVLVVTAVDAADPVPFAWRFAAGEEVGVSWRYDREGLTPRDDARWSESRRIRMVWRADAAFVGSGTLSVRDLEGTWQVRTHVYELEASFAHGREPTAEWRAAGDADAELARERATERFEAMKRELASDYRVQISSLAPSFLHLGDGEALEEGTLFAPLFLHPGLPAAGLRAEETLPASAAYPVPLRGLREEWRNTERCRVVGVPKPDALKLRLRHARPYRLTGHPSCWTTGAWRPSERSRDDVTVRVHLDPARGRLRSMHRKYVGKIDAKSRSERFNRTVRYRFRLETESRLTLE